MLDQVTAGWIWRKSKPFTAARILLQRLKQWIGRYILIQPDKNIVITDTLETVEQAGQNSA